jgi:parallel beta-helix repeat protein
MKRNGSYLKVYLLCIFVVSLILYSTIAFGATLLVPADYSTIQAGINAAMTGDTVLVADGIYMGNGNKNLEFRGKAITVQSESGPGNCIIDLENIGRGFFFHSGEGQDSLLSGFTIKNSKVAYNAIDCVNSSSPTITNCIITGNGGAGIECNDNSSPTITNCIITGNGFGVNLYNSSSPTITNCIITGNGGSGIFCGDNSSPTITNCIISNNTADYGGGIHCYNASPTITDSTITGNATVYTGAIHGAGNSSLTITNCSITDNTGGGIASYDSSLTITNCSITDNTGWGINCYNSPSLTISDSMIARNSQRGIQVANSSSASITNCTITGNTTEWGGAGIEFVNSSPTVTN